MPLVAFTAYPFLSFLIGTNWHGIQAAKARGEMLFLASFKALELIPNSWQW
jgi:hypothetical protein